ncbi:MAG: TrbG/VirB9 family P-type conjugative transfer protein [Schwartzia sp.]|nr:TrbG/VirB9 family P-type conjugative transfer protein [Schwartzia sp. (in: firmicutes)]
MSRIMRFRKSMAVFAAMACFSASSAVFAQSTGRADLDQMIMEEQRILDNLQGRGGEDESLRVQIEDLQDELRSIRHNRSNYDSQGAIEALAQQIASLTEQLSVQTDAQRRIMSQLEEMRNNQQPASAPGYGGYDSNGNRATGNSSKFLVYPGPSEEISYTQDAINSQGNSTMVFRYAPNQLYKIYCRMGYLTDLAFHKGEKITFAGGGDTAGWAVNSATVDGVPHLYIKPVVPTSDTNLIVTTDHHSYQLLLQTSDWYNPMVVWSYDIEDSAEVQNILERDARNVTSGLAVSDPDSLNFDYEIKGSGEFKPTMVFDDGKKMFIKFKRLSGRLPVLFGRERGKKMLSMLNYSVKDNTYIVDRVCDEAELRVSENEGDKIRIKKKK